MRTRLFLLGLIVALFFVPIAKAEPEYTGVARQDIQLLGTEVNGWNLDVDCGTAPPFSVAEIIVENDHSSVPISLGVRNTSSILERRITLNDDESSPTVNNRFLVTVDGSGNIDYYVRFTTDPVGFYLVGWWSGVEFNEQWVNHSVTAAQDDMWFELQAGLDIQSNRAHLITIAHGDQGKEQVAGLRNTSSVQNRVLPIMEAEGGGYQTATLFVQSDNNGFIDVYTEQFDDHVFCNQGYFNESLGFVEDWFEYTPIGAENAWADWDLSASMDVDGRVVDVLTTNIDEVSNYWIGIRENGGNGGIFQLKKAEAGGYSCLGRLSGSDLNGVVETWSTDNDFTRYFYGGYFKYIPYITTPNLLFGAGFNASNPFVNLNWNHLGTVDNFEIHHGNTNITLTFLAFTANLSYNHTGLVNGSYHWYMIRSTFFHVPTLTWFNSSFTPLNLERVFYIQGVGGTVNITRISGSWVDYNASSITVIDGTYIAGNLASLETVDGDFYQVSENLGADPLEIRINYTGLNTSLINLGSRIYCNYTGNPAHVIQHWAWNFNDAAWVIIIEDIGHHALAWHNASISLNGDFINGAGSVWLKVEHVPNGAAGHIYRIDYAQLRAFIPTGLGGVVTTSPFMWLTLFFIMAFAGAIALKGLKK